MALLAFRPTVLVPFLSIVISDNFYKVIGTPARTGGFGCAFSAC